MDVLGMPLTEIIYMTTESRHEFRFASYLCLNRVWNNTICVMVHEGSSNSHKALCSRIAPTVPVTLLEKT